jgi:hypothetical protein
LSQCLLQWPELDGAAKARVLKKQKEWDDRHKHIEEKDHVPHETMDYTNTFAKVAKDVSCKPQPKEPKPSVQTAPQTDTVNIQLSEVSAPGSSVSQEDDLGISEREIEEMKEAIQQAAVDRANGRDSMFRNTRGLTGRMTASVKVERSGKEKEKERIIVKVPIAERYDKNGIHLSEEKEVLRVIAKPKKKATQTMFKNMIKTKMDKIVSQFTKEELDLSVTKSKFSEDLASMDSEGVIEAVQTVARDHHLFEATEDNNEPVDNDEYAVKSGKSDFDLKNAACHFNDKGSCLSKSSQYEEPIDYQQRAIHPFPEQSSLNPAVRAIAPGGYRSEYWTEEKFEAAQDEVLEYWSQFDKFT